VRSAGISGGSTRRSRRDPRAPAADEDGREETSEETNEDGREESSQGSCDELVIAKFFERNLEM